MPQPPEPTILAELWAPPPGNPDDIEARLAQLRLRQAVDALPPVTRQPLVPWGPQAELEGLLAEGDHAGLAALYGRGTPLDRHQLVDRVAESWGDQGTTTWLEQRPDDPVAMVARAFHLQRAAWRGQGVGDADPTFVAMTMDTTMEWSRELCARAATLLPGDPTPLVVAQRAATGGRDDAMAAAARWQDIDELHYFGNVALMSMLNPDVAGEPGDQLVLARRLHAIAPSGHVTHLVALDALCELYGRRVFVDGVPPYEADRVFVEHAALIRSVHAATVGHEAWDVGPLEGMARNLLMFCAFFGDDDALARREMRATRGHCMDVPWKLKGDEPVIAYQRARAWLVEHVDRP